MRDYYAALGVARTASQDEIKQAFRRLAREHHPDVKQGDPQADERFKEINEAYQVLSDPERRAQYDRFGTVQPVGAALRYDLALTLEEAASGVEKSIEITRVDTCPSCFGTGAERGSAPETCST